ncbi:MAG TPA: 1,4-dihydroxy-2-naphthoate octaprenyltransferase [Anaerolineae bacterium]|nr:1,4-dihydroxy-2-naphthoate octaprenyltransferase [Anaerolineae bacterium]
MSLSKSDRRPTIKVLSWQLLESVHAPEFGEERWEKLCREVGAPEFRHVDPERDCPIEPFNQALTSIDQELGKGDGALIEAFAVAWVDAWAERYHSLVQQLQARPDKMLEIVCTEVLPHECNAASAVEILDSRPDRLVLRMGIDLLEGYKIGMLRRFSQIAGGEAEVKSRGGEIHVSLRVGEPPPKPSRWALFVNATRLPFLTASVVPVLVGTGVGWKDGFLNAPLFLMAFFGAAFFHIGANVINDYFDHTSGADEANLTPTPFAGGSRLIQRGVLTARQVRNLALLFYALGTAIGLVLVALRGWQLLLFGLAGFILGWIYTAPPIRLVHRGVGEVAIGLAFGPVIVVGSYWVQAMRWSNEALLASIPVGLLIAAVLYINEFPDRRWDARAGKRTLVVRLPMTAAVIGYGLLVGGAYLTILAGVLAGALAVPALLALLTLPAAWKAFAVLRREHAFPYRLIPANAGTIFTHLTTGMLLFFGYVIAGFSRFL